MRLAGSLTLRTVLHKAFSFPVLLAALLVAGVFVGGSLGPMIVLIVPSASFKLLLYYCAYLRSGNVKAAFVASALVLPVAQAFFALRPELLGYNFFLNARSSVTVLGFMELFRQDANYKGKADLTDTVIPNIGGCGTASSAPPLVTQGGSTIPILLLHQ